MTSHFDNSLDFYAVDPTSLSKEGIIEYVEKNADVKRNYKSGTHEKEVQFLLFYLEAKYKYYNDAVNDGKVLFPLLKKYDWFSYFVQCYARAYQEGLDYSFLSTTNSEFHSAVISELLATNSFEILILDNESEAEALYEDVELFLSNYDVSNADDPEAQYLKCLIKNKMLKFKDKGLELYLKLREFIKE